MTVVDQISIGIAQGPQNSIVDEALLDAINVTEDGVPPPPPSSAFPWWLVGIGALAAVVIRTRHIMKKEKRS